MEQTLSDAEIANLPGPAGKDLLTRLYGGALSLFLGAPVVADVDRIVTSVDWADGSLTIAAQPDVPRNLTVALTDADNSVTGLLTITGLDPSGRVVVETMQPDGAGGGKTLTGTKIFASVTSAVISGTSGALAGTDVVVIGVGNVIGLGIDIPAAAAVTYCALGGTKLTPTVATGESTSGVNASAGTYDGTKLLHAFVMPARYA